MILLHRCLECLKNYFHLWGLQKSLVAPPLVIFSVAPLVKTIFLDSPVTTQYYHITVLGRVFLMTSNVILFECHLSLIGPFFTKIQIEYFTGAKPYSIPAETFISLNRITR
jgi:hypothetical protein